MEGTRPGIAAASSPALLLGRDPCLAASGLCGLSRLCTAGLRTGLLLGITAGLRDLGPRRWLHRPASAGLPQLPSAASARCCCWPSTGPCCRPAARPGGGPARPRTELCGRPATRPARWRRWSVR